MVRLGRNTAGGAISETTLFDYHEDKSENCPINRIAFRPEE